MHHENPLPVSGTGRLPRLPFRCPPAHEIQDSGKSSILTKSIASPSFDRAPDGTRDSELGHSCILASQEALHNAPPSSCLTPVTLRKCIMSARVTQALQLPMGRSFMVKRV